MRYLSKRYGNSLPRKKESVVAQRIVVTPANAGVWSRSKTLCKSRGLPPDPGIRRDDNNKLLRQLFRSNIAKYLFVLCALSAFPALAQAPLFYTRTTLLVKASTPPESNPGGTYAIDTEMRDALSSARTPGWYSFTPLGDYKGAAAIFTAPTPVTLNRVNNYAPIDILFIDEYGAIFQIMPNLNLGELQDPIDSAQPVTMVLYLKAGSQAAMGLKPGDHVQHKMFKKKPEVLVAPSPQSLAPSTSHPLP